MCSENRMVLNGAMVAVIVEVLYPIHSWPITPATPQMDVWLPHASTHMSKKEVALFPTPPLSAIS